MIGNLETQLQAGAPLSALAIGILLLMLLLSVRRNHRAVARVATLAFVVAFIACLVGSGTTELTGLLVVDGYARFAMALVALAGAATVLLLYGYFSAYDGYREEIYLLLLIAAFGAMVLVCAHHVASLLLGLETMSVALFGMIAYPVRQPRALEAGIKYLVLSAAATATLLFGFALIYAATGGLQFDQFGERFSALGQGDDRRLAEAGMALVWVGFGFKLSLVPFHLWTADVYEGAPAPVTGFLASIAKGVVAIVLLRWVQAVPLETTPVLDHLLSALAIATIAIGNFGALMQNNVKRLLAYSSIAHFGYLLVPFLVGGRTAEEAVLLYVAAYTAMTIGSFGAVSVISGSLAHDDADHLYDYRGLFWRRPLVTSAFAPLLMAQAGVPLTVGFLAKFYILAAAVDRHGWVLAVAVVVGSAVGLYYYLRLMIVQFLPKPGGMSREGDWSEMSIAAAVALVTVAAAVIGYGVWPQPLTAAVSRAIASLH